MSIRATVAIEKEIKVLLKAKSNEPPSMVEVSFAGTRYRQILTAHTTLAVKREPIHA